jgi:hypothetical protein
MIILPDEACDDSMQPEPQFVPPHVRDKVPGCGVVEAVSGCGGVEAVPGCGVVEEVLGCAEKTLHSPSNPRAVISYSTDANVTLRKPVVDMKTSLVLTDLNGYSTISEHEALLHRETMLH